MKSLYGYVLSSYDSIVEIGGGYGDLSLELLLAGCNVKVYIEPDAEKYTAAVEKLSKRTICLQCGIGDLRIINAIGDTVEITIVMQDVIEHIPLEAQRAFFDELRLAGKKVTLIGRTPNLKSPFGMRNSFGDNTHIYRLTDTSLKDFLSQMGFNKISIHSEPYKITGLVSLARSVPYYLTLLFVAGAFVAIYGSREGWMAPNLVFKAE